MRFCIALKETFSNSITFTVISKYGRGAAVQNATVFGPVYHAAFRRVLWNGRFYTFIKSPFTEYVILEIHWLWGSSFFPKCSKFNENFRNVEKNWEKFFCFWDNRIGIGRFKFSLLKIQYLSSAFNVLTNSLKIFHSIKRGFLKLNYLRCDQEI